MNESNKIQGWIRLYRSIRNNPVWEDKPFSKGQAWIDLLMLANYEDHEVMLGSEKIKVKAGSFITSTCKLAERWGWTRAKVQRFMKRLENDTQIKQSASSKRTIVTLINWASYQDERAVTEQYASSNRAVTERKPITANTKEKKEQKEKDENPFDHPADDRTRNDPQFDLFWKAYPRKVGKTKAYAAWKRIHPNRELFEKIMAAVETAKSSRQWMENYGQFIPHPTTWLNRGGWDDELPDPNMVDGHRLTDTQMAQYKHYHGLGWSTEDILGYLGVITGDDNGEANIY